MSQSERLNAAILEAGVGVEQIGLDDGVRLEIDEDEGTYTLTLGSEGEESFDDIEEALERIAAYGEEYGGDGTRPGAIVELVRKLNGLLSSVPVDERFDALATRFSRVEALARRLGLERWKKVSGARHDAEVTADEHGDVGFFEDGNGVLWYVFVEDGRVRYRVWDGAKFDER